MERLEQKTQIAICEWLALQHPRIAGYIIKIDNEGKRTVGGHIIARRMGLHPGASDLFLAWPVGQFHGHWMEIKPDGWKGAYGQKAKLHHEKQILFLEKMRECGFFTSFVIGVDQGINAFETYFKSK